jgi:hypothetical protein
MVTRSTDGDTTHSGAGNADATVAMFAARLKDAGDLDSARDDLASVVQQALEPARMSVWISPRD